jgi:hypothetical protein
MKTFYEPGFLLEVPPAPESTTVKTFPTADGQGKIFWNQEQLGFHILKLPDIATIQGIVEKAVQEILRVQWEQTIVPLPPPDQKFTRGARSAWIDGQFGTEPPFWHRPVTEREALLRAHCPRTVQEAVERTQVLWLTSRGNVSAITPSENGITDPRVWLSHFYGLFWQMFHRKEKEARGIVGRQPPSHLKGRWALPVIVACELRTRGYVLGQQDMLTHISRFLGAAERDNNEALVEHIRAYLPTMSRRMVEDFRRDGRTNGMADSTWTKIANRSMDLGFGTSLSTENDISWEFADTFRTPSPNLYYTHSAQVTGWLRDKALANGGGKRSIETQEDPFMAILEPYRSSVPKWVALLSEYRKTIVVKKAREKGRSYLDLLDWVAEDESRHDPMLIRRDQIRNDQNRDAPTLHKKIREMDVISKSKNALLNAYFSLFDYVSLKDPSFRNPIFIKLDGFSRQIGERSSIGKTYRKRIPSYVLEDFKTFLVTPTEDGGFRWGDWVSEQERIIINGQSVFCPLRPAILAMLAAWPLRINQVSWLDSGELDEISFDHSAGRFTPHSGGVPGRRMGVVQPALDDAFDESHRLDLLVAINKRPLGEPSEYTIPYMDERTLWVIRQVREWQIQYGTSPQLVREADAPYDNAIAQDDTARELMPEICPLFRDPTHRGLFPPSYGRMKGFWSSACLAYDHHNAEWKNPKTGRVQKRKGWPQLSKEVEKDESVSRKAKNRVIVALQSATKIRYRYDLYSLKVGGVSHLIDRGIPLAIVSAMAGHKTLSMTLRYFVLDRTVWREKLSKLAKEDRNLQMRPAEIETRLRDISSHQEWLLGNSDGAFTALQHAVAEGRNFTISTTGICPGTRCEEGLRLKRVKSDGENRSGVVPGSLCGLCDFRVYGPPFLLGLAKEFNETLYTLSELASQQQKLRTQQRELEAADRSDEAIVCRNEDEELTRRAEPDCAHAARLYEMITECVQMAEKAGAVGSGLQPALLAQKPSARPMVEAVGNFEQWREILEMAEVMPATKSLIPDQVGARFQNKLMGVLARNGAEPFLAVLPSEMARRASLDFAALLERAVPSSDDREAVFEGRRLLSEVGVDEDKFRTGTKLLERKYSVQTANRLTAPTTRQLSEPSTDQSTNQNST